MAPIPPFCLEPVHKRLRIERGQILYIKAERSAGRIDGLTPFRIDPEAQHGVTPAKPFDRNSQSFHVKRPPLELKIKMGRNFSEYPIRLASDPIGHLHRG
jgi:hypothetical protein